MSNVSMQFEIWQHCNNRCEFCYLGDRAFSVSDDEKIQNIIKVNSAIDKYFSEHEESIKAIGFIGGDFFQGQIGSPEVKTAFFDLCKKSFDLINNDKIMDFWCYCTLTIGDQKDLYELIELFDKTVEDKNKHSFWIQVSYDTKGRFNAPGKLENWHRHMIKLQEYPFIKFNVTSIMTEDFLQAVISGKLNLREFQNTYKNGFFFKQPNVINDGQKEPILERLPWFFPKRKTFLQFLQKLKYEYPDLFKEILNIELRSDYMFNQLDEMDIDNLDPQIRNKQTWEETRSAVIPKCKHPINYQCYSDSDECCLCDYFKIEKDI